MKHYCHARGCKIEVHPQLFMCHRHWFMLPTYLRKGVTRAYRPGQEIDKNPSSEYVSIAKRAINYLDKLERTLGEIDGQMRRLSLP